MTMAQGSYLEFSIPMITEETGYVSKVNGQLMHLDATTSLQFRQLLNWETFEVWNSYVGVSKLVFQLTSRLNTEFRKEIVGVLYS